MAAGEWAAAEHVGRYLSRADAYPRRSEGEAALLEQVPGGARRILDSGPATVGWGRGGSRWPSWSA